MHGITIYLIFSASGFLGWCFFVPVSPRCCLVTVVLPMLLLLLLMIEFHRQGVFAICCDVGSITYRQERTGKLLAGMFLLNQSTYTPHINTNSRASRVIPPLSLPEPYVSSDPLSATEGWCHAVCSLRALPDLSQCGHQLNVIYQGDRYVTRGGHFLWFGWLKRSFEETKRYSGLDAQTNFRFQTLMQSIDRCYCCTAVSRSSRWCPCSLVGVDLGVRSSLPILLLLLLLLVLSSPPCFKHASVGFVNRGE